MDLMPAHPWQTTLHICGQDLDFGLITGRLGIKNASTVRAGERYVPTLADGRGRLFDPRWSQDHWAKSLRGKVYSQDLGRQIEAWVSLLHPVRSAFAEFEALGYWSVLDCEVCPASDNCGSVQYRLEAELLQKVARLGIDIDFTVSLQPAA